MFGGPTGNLSPGEWVWVTATLPDESVAEGGSQYTGDIWVPFLTFLIMSSGQNLTLGAVVSTKSVCDRKGVKFNKKLSYSQKQNKTKQNKTKTKQKQKTK